MGLETRDTRRTIYLDPGPFYEPQDRGPDRDHLQFETEPPISIAFTGRSRCVSRGTVGNIRIHANAIVGLLSRGHRRH